MAREYAQLRHDIWSDDEWRDLTVPAQHLYMVILSDGDLSYCGVTDWHPGKLSQRSGENTGRDTLLAAAELSERFFLVIDEETEEVLIRSYLRHDPLMRNPRLAVTMAKDFGRIASNKIRAVVVHELARLKKEEPDLGAWEKPQVKTVLRQKAVNPREVETDLPIGAATYLGVGLGVTDGKGLGSVYQPPTTATATTTATPTSSKEDAGPKSDSSPQGSTRSRRGHDEASGVAVAS